MYHEAGKGSRQRPVDKKAFDTNYDLIFRKKDAPNHSNSVEQEGEGDKQGNKQLHKIPPHPS
jgi:hypothetical protein